MDIFSIRTKYWYFNWTRCDTVKSIPDAKSSSIQFSPKFFFTCQTQIRARNACKRVFFSILIISYSYIHFIVQERALGRADRKVTHQNIYVKVYYRSLLGKACHQLVCSLAVDFVSASFEFLAMNTCLVLISFLHCLLNPIVCFPVFFCPFCVSYCLFFSSHGRGQEHLWWPMTFSCDIPSQVPVTADLYV